MNVYEDMARDAGARGDEIQQMAQAIEADHRATFGKPLQERVMNEQSDQTACGCQRIHYQPEDLEDGHFRERWRCIACTSEFIRVAELAALEQRVERLGKLEEIEQACIKLYVGEITKAEWRRVVRNGPLAQKLVALAEEEA